jgi:hypothetical protein
LELLTQFNLFPFLLDTANFLIIMERFQNLRLGAGLNKSLLFCVLLDGDADSCRVRDEVDPQHYPPEEYYDADGVQKPFPVFVDFEKLGAYLDAKDVAEVVAGSPEASKEAAGLLWEPDTQDGDEARPEERIKCTNERHDHYEIGLVVPAKRPRQSE